MAYYDPQQVREAISIRDLFARDGHELKRAGTSLMCLSPFSDERTPSCSVNENKGVFFCFSTDTSGGVFDYWMATRGVDFSTAVQQLGELTHLSPQDWSMQAPRPKREAPKPEPLAKPFSATDWEAWEAECDRLLHDNAEVLRIAEWRGFTLETVRWAAKHRIMATPSFMGARRESFLVTRPNPDDFTKALPVSIHHRLAPESPRNTGKKASWRYAPSKVGAWPIIIGEAHTALHLFVIEGQWDALALIDVMGWQHKFPPTVAIIAFRGATSWRKLVEHQALLPHARIAVIADNDKAGHRWFSKDNLLDALRAKCPRGKVRGFCPDAPGCKDFNDLLQAGAISREEMLTALHPLMQQQRGKRPTFLQWCKQQRRDGLAAMHEPAITFTLEARDKPKGPKPRSAWQSHWRKHSQALNPKFPGMHAMHALWDAYRTSVTNPSPSSKA